jgi:serine/threonine protein kinase
MTATLSPALFLTAAFGVLAVIGAVASRTKLIDVQKEGLTVRKKGATHGLFVPWEQLSKLEIIDTPDWFGKTNYKLRFHTHNGPTVRISWRDVLTSQQGPPLLNALKTWAPEAIARCNLPVPGLEDTQTNYTQLWLQYFSAPARRERSSDLAAGATIYGGKYQIAGRLSGGGHGTTYLAVMDQAAKTDNDAPKSECDLVIKEYVLPVHRGSLILDRTIEKLNQEAAILRRISHPQIVGLRDSFVEDYRGYLVMEYVQGVSLKDLVDREGPQQESFVCHLAVQMCEILSYLHALTPPVVHRDFTPDNLILQDNLQVKLVDFNVAHELEGSVTATVVGKHSYLPPEQFRGKPVPQSDIYALGCTVFYLLVGADPEPITSSHPQARRAEVSSELDGIIARATALEPKRRYADVDAMKAELVHLLERLPV